MNSIEDFNNLEYNQDCNYKNDYDKYYYDKLSELISIPYIVLKFSKSIILIKSYCTNNHESILPLNEFLIKYHPLYKYYQNYQFCNKCWIKLIYGKKTTNSYFTNKCDVCDIYFCSHKSNHCHKLKTVEKEFLELRNLFFQFVIYVINHYLPIEIMDINLKMSLIYFILKKIC
jgi:hypothetical protein